MDFSFPVARVYHGYRQRAARGAVLFPAVPGRTLHTDEGLVAALSRLRRAWRRQLAVLREAGWAPAATPRDLQYLRNCPPFCVATGQASRRCGRAMLCPFCWARRYVLAAFDHMDGLMFPGTGRRLSTPGTVLLETHELHVVRRRDPVRCAARIDEIISGTPGRRASYAACPGRLGGMSIHRIDPGPEGVAVTRSTLIWAPERSVRALSSTLPDTVGWKARSPTAGELARAVAGVCSYPVGMLYGEAPVVMALLAQFHKRRMLSRYRFGRPFPGM